MYVQPWMTADEIQEAVQSAVAANPTGPDGRPATVQTIYLRYIRDVIPLQSPGAVFSLQRDGVLSAQRLGCPECMRWHASHSPWVWLCHINPSHGCAGAISTSDSRP